MGEATAAVVLAAETEAGTVAAVLAATVEVTQEAKATRLPRLHHHLQASGYTALEAADYRLEGNPNRYTESAAAAAEAVTAAVDWGAVVTGAAETEADPEAAAEPDKNRREAASSRTDKDPVAEAAEVEASGLRRRYCPYRRCSAEYLQDIASSYRQSSGYRQRDTAAAGCRPPV